MTKEEILQRIEKSGVVPVIRAKSADEALRIVENAYENGIDVFEITMTVPDAFGVIKTIAEKYGEKVLIGAGTVLDEKSADESLKAGAKFIVTPCLIKTVIEFCNKHETLICAGALTPTEVFEAWQTGADVVKIFPASAVGGSSYIKALKAPFPEIRLMPTGGLKAENLDEYREAGAIAIGVGFKG
jgi:2-dehydro-3-deoxyphosphogluconate aldolase/(4S)-4-hydroxy-2-oxoglutarate aldolase